MTFSQIGCRYKGLQTLDGKRSPMRLVGSRTAAFLLRIDEIWPGGPGLIGAWGLNAIATLAWCSLLRYRYMDLFENRGLTMFELHPTEPPKRPVTHEWALDWKATPVFETGIELPARPDESELDISIQPPTSNFFGDIIENS